MVANGHNPQPLRHLSPARGQPLDLPDGPHLLRRLRHLGPGGSPAHLRQPRDLPRRQLVLPRRRRRSPPRLVGGKGIPQPEMDPTYPHARSAWGHVHDAAGLRRELHELAHRRVSFWVCAVSVPAGVVAEV